MRKTACILAAVLTFSVILRADVSPWDAWRLGYTRFEQGEGCRDRGEYTKALKAFQEALEHYNSVRRARPDWNQKVIARRIADCERECERMKRLLGDSEPSSREMAESGASALRPASSEVAKEMDDIRKQLSEARAELVSLRQKTSAQRNYEQEITQLLRDQRISRERYMLLERRYRDLDRASRQPDRRTQELQEQLLEEKMQTEHLKKQIALYNRRSKSEDARFRATESRRRSLERQLGEKIAEIARLNRESTGLRNFQKDASERQANLSSRVEALQKQLVESEQDRSAKNDELVKLKQKLIVVSGNVSEIENIRKQEQELRSQLNQLNDEKNSLRGRLDSSLKEIEKQKVKLIQLQVLESARTELERHAATQVKSIKQLGSELEKEKKISGELNRTLAALKAEYAEKEALAKLQLQQKEQELKRIGSDFDALKKGKQQSESQKITNLQKELDSLRKVSEEAEKELVTLKLDVSRLTADKKRLSEDLKKYRQRQGSESAQDIKELQAKLRSAEEAAAEARKLLETNIAGLSEKNKKDAEILAARNAEIKKLNEALVRSEQKNARISESRVFAEENRKLQQEIEQLKHRIQSRDSDIARVGAELENVKKQNDELVSAVQKSKNDSGRLAADNAALKAELERERSAAGAAAGELQRMRELKTGLEQDLKSAVDRAERLDKRLSNRDSEDFKRLTASQDERKKQAEKIAGFQNELARVRAEADSLRQSSQTLKNELEKLNTEHTRIVAERNLLKEDRQKHLAAIGKLAGIEKNFDALKKNFAALQAENKENKLLIEAAKPREAELAQIKLRLTELDQLKAQLAKEQRFNEELKSANRKLESERGNLVILRSKLNNAQKRIGELEPLKKEIEALKKLNSELAVAKNLEADLAKAKVQLNSFESVKLELDHSRKRIRKLELEKLESERSAARAKNLASGTQLLNAELETARRTADELAKDKALRELELARLRTQLGEIPRLQAEVKRLRDLKSTADPAAAVEFQQLKRRAREAQVMEDSLALQKKEAEYLKSQLTKIRSENSALRLRAAENGQLKDMVKKLNAVNRSLQKGLDADSREFAELKRRAAVFDSESKALKELRVKEKTLMVELENKTAQLRAMQNKSGRIDILESENAMLKKQSAELENFDEMRKQLLTLREQAAVLKSRASAAERLQKQLLAAETRIAEKQAELDRSRTMLSASNQLRSELLSQKQQNSAIQLELSRVRAESDRIKLKLLQTEALQRELERQKRLTEELVAAKGLEGQLAQAKLRLAEFEQIKKELARVTRYNNELTEMRQKLEKELAERGSSGDRWRSQLDMVSTLPAGKPEDFTASGKIAEADGSFELAVWNYEQALKVSPNHAPAAARLGGIMLERRNYQRAVQLLSTARAVDPVNIHLACQTAEAYIGLKRNGNALAILSPLAERRGDDYRVQLLLGKALAGSGDNRGAEARLRIAMRQAPAGVFTPGLELAKFLVATDVRRLDEAARIYEAARVAGAAPDIELEPKLGGRLDERREVSGFLLTAAREAEKSGDWKTAGWYYKQLVDMGREKDKYVPRLAFAQYKNGNSAGALETLAFNRATALGTLVAAFIQLSGREYPAMLGSLKKALAFNRGKAVLIPADWSELAVELERLKRKHSSEMVDAVRRAFRIR